MKRVDTNSDDFYRDFALQLLKQHRRETQFKIQNINMLTVYELEERGCKVVFDYSKKGLDTVSSPVPFGRLVTKAEWWKDRLETIRALAWGVICIGGTALVVVLGAGFNRRGLTAVFWYWACVCLCAGVTRDLERIRSVVVGLILFGIGIAVKLLGW